ncbi:MAG: carboxypeptidase regulatory-like domain-containing protein [Planctomycetota bacterium]
MFRLSLLIGLLVPCLLGCNNNPRTYPVTGKVVYPDGSHPEFGDIEFFNAEAKLNARGRIQKDGTFELGTFDLADGAVEGTHKVIILQRTRNHLTAQLEGEIAHDHGDLMDPKYYDYRTSKLTAKVEPIDQNQIEIQVRKMKKKKQEKADH